MKLRTGFVSNSSSSSFIVSVENNQQDSPQFLKMCNKEKMDELGYENEYRNDLVDKYTKKDLRIIMIDNVEYGAEEDAERIASSLIKHFDPKTKVHFDWEE